VKSQIAAIAARDVALDLAKLTSKALFTTQFLELRQHFRIKILSLINFCGWMPELQGGSLQGAPSGTAFRGRL
jgi:hypothetical protein